MQARAIDMCLSTQDADAFYISTDLKKRMEKAEYRKSFDYWSQFVYDDDDVKDWREEEMMAMEQADLEGKVVHACMKMEAKMSEQAHTKQMVWPRRRMVQKESEWASMEMEDMAREERQGKLTDVLFQLGQEIDDSKRAKRKRHGPMPPDGPPPTHVLKAPKAT